MGSRTATAIEIKLGHGRTTNTLARGTVNVQKMHPLLIRIGIRTKQHMGRYLGQRGEKPVYLPGKQIGMEDFPLRPSGIP